MVAKVRSVLILSIPFSDIDRAVVTSVFHTTALLRSGRKALRQELLMVFLQPLEHSLPHFSYEANQLSGLVI